MSLTTEQVRTVAQLARLALRDEDVPRYATQLSGILEMVAQLANAPTEGIEPMAHPLDMAQRLRPDGVSETDQRERFQSIAPAVQEGLYLVPKVIE